MLEMRKQMKFIRKCPFFLLLLSTGLLFSVIGFGGLKNIYATQEYDPVTSPVLSVMFTALNDEIYPWQMFAEKGIMTIANNVDENTGKAGDDTATPLMKPLTPQSKILWKAALLQMIRWNSPKDGLRRCGKAPGRNI